MAAQHTLPNRLHIEVIQEDIDTAIESASNGCAIWNAIARKYPLLLNTRVTESWIALTHPVERVRFKWHTPEKVADWIRRYDNFEDVEPMVFSLQREHAHTKPMAQRTAEERLARHRRNLQYQQKLTAMSPAQRKAMVKRNAKRELKIRRNGKVA